MSRVLHTRLPISAIGFRLDRPMFESARPIVRARRILVAPMLALALLTLSAGGALGNALAAPDGTATTVPTPTGYDISYPQCGGAYPRDIAFGIVGVTRGLAYRANPYTGAGRPRASKLARTCRTAQLF